VFTWSSPDTRFRDSLVTVTFRPSSSSTTIVEIHQVGLPDEESRASHFAGWSDVLRKLGPSPSHEVGRQTSVPESAPATEDPDV
jgi:Activator of Hsp90 ATPase homolog 1-like protein